MNISVNSCTKDKVKLISRINETTVVIPAGSKNNTLELPTFFCTLQACCKSLETGTSQEELSEEDIEMKAKWFENYTLARVEKVG